ncbi:MAG: ParB/RepB/Spo0J family partition protein [Spirochaetia bacterium]|nr:ParB/RepB/Spo0J family partition protein [Spirochaetia bacterium]
MSNLLGEKKRLGRGLEALMKTEYSENVQTDMKIDIDKIIPNPNQPRKEFDLSALEELAASIKEKGIIQPILVEKENDGRYRIIAGERRYRAAKMAGLTAIPVVFGTFTPREKLEIALIENIQRKDLTPIEEANAYNALMAEEDLSQDELAKIVGKNRSTVANSLRLLKLSPEMQNALAQGHLTAGHARALLSVDAEENREKLFDRIIGNQISVREAEKIAADMNENNCGKKSKNIEKSSDLIQIEQKLKKLLKTKVSIKGTEEKGKLIISYRSNDELQNFISNFE